MHNSGGFAHGTFDARCLHSVADPGDISFDVLRVHRARGVFLESKLRDSGFDISDILKPFAVNAR
jgi:hypothetical protein